MRIVAVLTLLLLAGTARADDTKSPGLALGLSIGSTVGGGLLLGALAGDSEAEEQQVLPAALLFLTGPSWGHVYTGDYDLAVGGTLLRVLGVAMIVGGRGECDPNPPYDPDRSDDDPCQRINGTPALAAAGAVLFLGTAIAEIVDAPLAARRHNRGLAATVSPTVVQGGYGVAVVGQF